MSIQVTLFNRGSMLNRNIQYRSYREMINAGLPARRALIGVYKYFDGLRNANINHVFYDLEVIANW